MLVAGARSRAIVARNGEHFVQVRWADGKLSRFHAFGLRDDCRCSVCCDASIGQRLVNTAALARDSRALSVVPQASGTALAVRWSDGHAFEFDSSLLRAQCPSEWARAERLQRTRAEHGVREAWDRASWQGRPLPHLALPVAAAAQLNAAPSAALPDLELQRRDALDRAVVLPLLQLVYKHGFALVTGVPANARATCALIESVTHIRHTQFGGFWVFGNDGARGDTAYTNRALDPHTDGTYYDDPPGIQVLHCLEHDGPGGETTLVDGLAVLARLSASAVRLLRRQPLLWRYSEAGFLYQSTSPMLQLHADDSLRLIRFNNSDRAWLDVKPSRLASCYDALREAAAAAYAPEVRLQFKLRPGSVLFVDNWRVLHGRTSFTGLRRMCGAYLAHEDCASRARTLAARIAGAAEAATPPGDPEAK